MIALQTLDAFSGLVGNLAEFMAQNAVADGPLVYDADAEDAAETAFLTGAAVPPDPAQACVIGVIDDAIPFAHARLRAGADARVASVWMQDAPRRAGPVGADLPFGAEWRGAEISGLIARLGSPGLPDEDSLYRESGAVDFARPGVQALGFACPHGAAVAGLAAGFAADDAEARNHPVIGVALPPEVVRDTAGTFAPFYILLGILHIVHRTRRLCRWLERRSGAAQGSIRLPVVINISFGVSAGAKDGSSLLERFQDALSDWSPADDIGPVRFVMPMGNQRLSELEAELPAAGPEDDRILGWEVFPDDTTASSVELWGPPTADPPGVPMQAALSPPGQTAFARTAFTHHGSWAALSLDGAEIARASLQLRRTAAGWREWITIFIAPTLPEHADGTALAPPGLWRLLAERDGGGAVAARIQRDETLSGYRLGARQSRFRDPAVPLRDATGRYVLTDADPPAGFVRRAGTVNAYACATRAVRVGGLSVLEEITAPYSGLGLRGGANPEGDLMAGSDRSRMRGGVIVSGTRSGARMQMAGTSMASASATRWLAREIAAGRLGPAERPRPGPIDDLSGGEVLIG